MREGVSTVDTKRAAASRRGGWRRRYLPPQHGAWAMLAVPYLAGIMAAGYRWPDVPLALAWLAGYLLSYFVFQAVKTGRPGRVRDQLTAYGVAVAVLAPFVLVPRPRVLLYAPAFAVLIAVNAWYARRRRERALLNDAASIVQSCLMVFVVATIAGVAPRAVLGAFTLCLLYFLGTALYVKTMIRERDSVAYRRWSVGYHGVAFLVAALFGWWSAVLFAALLVRAALLPGRGLAPRRVGFIEMGACVLLLVVVALI